MNSVIKNAIYTVEIYINENWWDKSMVSMKWYVWIGIEEKKKNYKDRLGTVDAN